jgi:hypothetical protein
LHGVSLQPPPLPEELEAADPPDATPLDACTPDEVCDPVAPGPAAPVVGPLPPAEDEALLSSSLPLPLPPVAHATDQASR